MKPTPSQLFAFFALTLASIIVLATAATRPTRVQSSSDERELRCGSAAVSLIDLSVPVVFSTPMPDTNYVIILSGSGVSTASWSNKSNAGFTINLSLGISGFVDWLVTEYQ